MKIIFAGTPEISAAVLKTLVDNKIDVIACLTQPDRPQGRGLKLTASPVKEIALQYGIPVLQPQSLKDPNKQQELANLKPDLMIVLAYGLILPQAVLDIPKYGCINIHASILPRWRGAAPIQHAILAGDSETGITIMQMDAGLDTGDILKIYPCPILSNYSSADLYKELTSIAQFAILDTLQQLTAGALHATPQNAAQATYAHKLQKQHANIDWQLSAAEIVQAVRAYNPWPVAFSYFMNQVVRIWQAEVVIDALSSHLPGTIVKAHKNELQVATGNGIIRILSLQLAGKKIVQGADLCNVHHDLKEGARFTMAMQTKPE